MARLVARTTSDTPEPIGAVGFDAEQDAIKRRRLQLEALLAEPKLPGLAGGIANLALGITKGYHEGNLSGQEQDLAQRRAAAAQDWITRMPRPTPGVDEVNPSEPPPELGMQGGGPPMPTNYKEQMQPLGGMVPQDRPTFEHTPELPMIPTSMRDAAQWAQEGAGFSPYHAALASKVTEQAMTQPEKIAEAKRIREEKRAEKADAERIRTQEREIKRAEKVQDDADKAAEKEAQRAKDAADKYERDRANAADREALKIGLAGLGGAGSAGGYVDAGTSPRGNPLLRPSKGMQYFEMVNGKPEPYEGPVIGKGEAKSVEKAMDTAAQLKYTEDLANRVADPKNEKAFSFGVASGNVLANKTQGFISPEIFKKTTDEQAVLRAEVGRNFAELMHKLYGSAYTTGEQASAASFSVLPGMDARTVNRRLQQQVVFHREMEKKYGEKIRGAAAERSGSGKSVTVDY